MYFNFFKGYHSQVFLLTASGPDTLTLPGDASPSYFYDNYHWPEYSGNEGCTEPRVILANHIRHLNPDVRIILIIRHPVKRYDHVRARVHVCVCVVCACVCVCV